ncbi:MAG: hypothetical protein QOG85_1776 [Gaiellaceae bacterium]|jgi:hypothetical protein|nr:hypothetical protein [Gaiellaceae bacterium]
MTDHQLSTRDLAGASDTEDSTEKQQPTGHGTDASLTRDRAAEPLGATETGDTEIQPAGYTGGQETRDTEMGPAGYTGGQETRGSETAEPLGGTGMADTEAQPTGYTGGQETGDTANNDEPLFPTDQRERFTDRWKEIQTSFVDQPREAVADADSLVADLMQRLAASFSQERERLEGQWDRGDDVSTEDLRVALTRYRSFFDRLLAA